MAKKTSEKPKASRPSSKPRVAKIARTQAPSKRSSKTATPSASKADSAAQTAKAPKKAHASKTAAKSKNGPEEPEYGTNELRQDYLLEFKVLIANNRGKRPQDFASEENHPKESARDPFLEGNENHTTAEIGREGTENAWQIRWFENKFPLFDPKALSEPVKYNPLLQSEPARGFHEVIVGTPKKDRQLWDFTPKQIESLLRVYQKEIDRLQDQGYKFVLIFKNQGARAGTSIIHEHTQVVALPFVPPSIEEEISASGRYFRSRRRCAYCDVVKEERRVKERIAYENDTFVVICPYASKYNFEVQIFPKIHKSAFRELLPKDYEGLSDALAHVLKRLKKLNLDYNLEFHYEPLSKSYKEKNSGLHFHVEVLPRRQTWGGFELGTGILVNEVPPEMAASYYETGR